MLRGTTLFSLTATVKPSSRAKGRTPTGYSVHPPVSKATFIRALSRAAFQPANRPLFGECADYSSLSSTGIIIAPAPSVRQSTFRRFNSGNDELGMSTNWDLSGRNFKWEMGNGKLSYPGTPVITGRQRPFPFPIWHFPFETHQNKSLFIKFLNYCAPYSSSSALRISARLILPPTVFGSSSTYSMTRGYL